MVFWLGLLFGRPKRYYFGGFKVFKGLGYPVVYSGYKWMMGGSYELFNSDLLSNSQVSRYPECLQVRVRVKGLGYGNILKFRD